MMVKVKISDSRISIISKEGFVIMYLETYISQRKNEVYRRLFMPDTFYDSDYIFNVIIALKTLLSARYFDIDNVIQKLNHELKEGKVNRNE